MLHGHRKLRRRTAQRNEDGPRAAWTDRRTCEPLLGTDETAEQLERLQFTLGEGPCVDASRLGAPVLVPDLADPGGPGSDRWPAFVREAHGSGVRAVFAFPLRIGPVPLGAADLYRRRPGPLTADGLAGSLTLMDAIALALLDSDYRDDGHEMVGLGVHRAAGMVMVQLGCTIDEALARLRATAFAEATPIEEIADDVVNGRRRLQEDQP